MATVSLTSTKELETSSGGRGEKYSEKKRKYSESQVVGAEWENILTGKEELFLGSILRDKK